MKTIVVPFDFSPNAYKALSTALQLAKATASGVLVVHVVHQSPYKLAAAGNETEMNRLIRQDEMEKKMALQQETDEMLQALSLRFPAGQITIKAIYHPLIVEKIIELANAEDAGLIVMGTHGATGLRKVLFGSNTANMISRSAIPVLAIPGDYEYKPVEKIVYASDLEHLDTELKQIIPFAIALNAVIEVLHLDYGENDKKISAEEAETIIRKSPYQFIHLLIREANLNKPMLRQLKTYAEVLSPDWLIMFTKTKSMWDKLFLGSHTEDMSQALPLPLLSFKKPD
jgi:nucleotide-binding universal stress UspA family protein